jgi:hypothetical protein
MISKLLGISLLSSFSIFAQASFGLIGGVPFNNLTNDISAGSLSTVDKSGMYTIGPTFQLGLPLGFRVEADALYRPLGIGLSGTTLSASQWRFPVLAQYRFSGILLLKPFVEAGYSYDHVSISPAPSFGSISSSPAPSFGSISSHHGVVLGAGVDFKVPFVRISPEIRYTHDAGTVNAGNLLNTDQAEFLVGIRF